MDCRRRLSCSLFRFCRAFALTMALAATACGGGDVGGGPVVADPPPQCPDDGCASVQCPVHDPNACPLGLVPDACACCPYGLCGLGETALCNAADRPCAENLECVKTEGLVAEIHIFFQHSHTINTAEALGNLRSSEDTRQLFECYFSDGYGITEAIMYHEGKLELEGNEIAIANASLNPKYRTVQHWHDTWRQNNLGPRIGIGIVEEDVGGGVQYRCACKETDPVCGSDNRTYSNMCQLNGAAVGYNGTPQPLWMQYRGPCQSAPFIRSAPKNLAGSVGHTVVFDCEVNGYPVPSISWRFTDVYGITKWLPGDDTLIAIQIRGGPDRFTVTSWVQIMEFKPTVHTGNYTCLGTNSADVATASAVLDVRKMV